ncbi:MAG: NAD(P)H-dependent oxidoreductase, partial [Nitrososphaeraceae archaeon]
MATKNKLKVLGFAGSLRRGSYNKALLRAAADLLPEDMNLEIFDI